MDAITFTSAELAELLEVTARTFKSYVTRNTLEQKVKNKGWIIVNKEKIGRTVFYDLLPYQELTIRDILVKLNIREEELFSRYGKVRGTKEGLIMSKSEVSRETGIRRGTVTDWDKKMQQEGIIRKSGIMYRAVKDGTSYEISEEEYLSYWKTSRNADMMLQSIYNDYKAGLTTERFYQYRRDEIMSKLRHDKGYHVYKFDIYEEAEMFDAFIEALYK